MGVIYKARDTHLDRFAAIKVLPPEKVSDPDRKRWFIQEARAASALNHPSIITIYDIDQADGVDYIALEYVAGKTLDELIPRKGMRLKQNTVTGDSFTNSEPFKALPSPTLPPAASHPVRLSQLRDC